MSGSNPKQQTKSGVGGGAFLFPTRHITCDYITQEGTVVWFEDTN